LRVAAFPAAVNPLEWQGWIERPEFVMRFRVNVRKEFDPTAGAVLFKAPPSPAIEAARQAAPVAVFLKFAQYPLWSVMPGDGSLNNPEGARDVEVRDWRFPFGARALVDSSNRVISSSFHY
jgi:hypothetical protein